MPYCESHPSIVTELQCGRCARYICSSDLVHTPGGIRCDECAQVRRPPMYELSWTHYLRAVLGGLVAAVLLGVVGAFVFPPRAFTGVFFLAFGLVLGIGAGATVSEAIARCTGGKRGTAMQLIAATAVVLAVQLRVAVSGNVPLLENDAGGLIAALAGAVYASSKLR